MALVTLSHVLFTEAAGCLEKNQSPGSAPPALPLASCGAWGGFYFTSLGLRSLNRKTELVVWISRVSEGIISLKSTCMAHDCD